jgi:hypothetical protein
VSTVKGLALTAGLAGAIAAGVWGVPWLMDRMEGPAEPAAYVEAPAAAPEPARAPVVRRRAAAASKAPAVPATAPELHARLKPVLNKGTKLALAADGFRDAEQFATVAHAARNTQVPFVVLKHRVLTEGKSLTAAIRESKPDVNAAAEVRRARAAAREDVSSIVG